MVLLMRANLEVQYFFLQKTDTAEYCTCLKKNSTIDYVVLELYILYVIVPFILKAQT